jgi:ATP-dependent Clp protease ATP-binding subunit ClpA
MFERFTDRARHVLVYAQEEATLLDHGYIGTEHILLGLLADGQGDEDGVAAMALASFGITLEAARQNVGATVAPAVTTSHPGSPPFTPQSKRALELSLREALLLGHGYIGTEHLLLGLVREGRGVAAQVIVGLGAELGHLRQRVLELVDATAPVTGAPYPDLEVAVRPGVVAATSSAGPVPEADPHCRCGADLAETAAYRSIELPAAPGEVDQGPLSTTVVFCQHCGYVLGQAGPTWRAVTGP